MLNNLGTLKGRRMTNREDLVIPSNKDNILLIDNGCDISIISKNSFLIQTLTGIYYNVDGALLDIHASNLQLVSDCFTLAILPSNEFVILKLNNCLLDKNDTQTESLL